MTQDKRPSQKTSPNARAAERAIELVSGEDPAAQQALAGRHLARLRSKKGKSYKSLPATRVPPREPVRYLHPIPTRSRVLNAFLYEAGAAGVVPPTISVLDEQALAPKLVDIARRYMAPMAAATGNVEAALRIAAELPEVTGERIAQLVIRRALTDPGALGAIARDYEDHRRARAASEEDLVGSAILAAFAGRVVAHAQRLLGSHVRDEVQAALRRLVAPRAHAGPSGSPDGGLARRSAVRAPTFSERDARETKKRGTA